MKKGFVAFLVILILLAGGAFGSALFVKKLGSPVSKESQDSVRIEISSGMSVSAAGALLKANGLIKNQKLFYF